ncbi:MAG: type IV secretion system DNA-binding domain-containing protein [Pirellulaceae bacterium]|nr:ATP-binding protein [Planctomycetales bacterium]
MTDPSSIYEKLGVFYLGKSYDVDQRRLDEDYVLYDSKDLVTHAVIVGMTGSGKTGLGVTLLEEAAIDQIPALIVDPKGDMTNLLLNFPDLRPEDFRKWINLDDAARAGQTVDEFASEKARQWREGLAQWDQTGDRVRMLRDACEFAVYTPGSDAGIPISILSSFAVPPKAVLDDADMLRDRINTTATSLLALLGIDADPIRSREHILLTTILDYCWRQKQSVDLGTLIQFVQNPPVKKIGVMDLDAFFSAKDRFELAMSLNNLLAAPGFAAWMSGEALDVDRLLYTSTGKPKCSILYIAHLSESERMFFLSLLLNQTIGWMRSRPGTTSLRALLYIDELFGFMPPVAEPPTKKPLLTLLKQARAFGLGIVMATQNPVDLDYKGLSNTGTWFLGRLQTDQDKQRVLDGLEGASAEAGGRFNREEISNILSGIGKRVFLLHNVHESHPMTFQTRWALSYLSGPLTRTQIKELMAPYRQSQTPASSPSDPLAETDMSDFEETEQAAKVVEPESQRPVLPPEVPQVFLPPRKAGRLDDLRYEPRLLALAKVHFVDTRRGLAADEELALLTELNTGAFGIDWESAEPLELDPSDLETEPLTTSASYGDVPTEAAKAKSYATWKKALADHLYRSRRYELYRCQDLSAISEPGESERDFRIRLAERAREERDAEVAKLREKYEPKIRTLEERLQKAEMRVERERQQASGAKLQSAINFGATVLSAMFGRKTFSSTTIGRAASTARGMGRMREQQEDVDQARQAVDNYEDQLEQLENDMQRDVEELSDRFAPHNLPMEVLQLKPRKTDVDVRHVALAWVPAKRLLGD